MYCIVEKKVVPLHLEKIHSINPLKNKDYEKEHYEILISNEYHCISN